MKKQFFILLTAVLAFSISNSYGQALPGSAPRGTSCVDDALHPIAGKTYTYTVTGGPIGGKYTWWSTKDSTFLSSITTNGETTTTSNLDKRYLVQPASPTPGIDYLNAASPFYGTQADSNYVKITWSDAILGKTKYRAPGPNPSPTFVSVWYSGGSLCTDNLKVFELDPLVAFTVDIKNIEHGSGYKIARYDSIIGQCFDIVRTAQYRNKNMVYDYGTNVLYYEVVAANFTNSWIPTFNLAGLNAVQDYKIEWTYSKPADFATATWNTYFTKVGADTTTTLPKVPVVTNQTNTTNGVSIYVRVTVANHNFEGIADETVSLFVDGQNSVGNWDIDNPTNCLLVNGPDKKDKADQNLLKRPSIDIPWTTSTTTPNTQIIPGNEVN